MLTELQKQQAIDSIVAMQIMLNREPNLKAAFTDRTCDGRFMQVGVAVAKAPGWMTATELVWKGYEFLSDSLYADI